MDWLKRNQKKVLAVLGVLLMVGFLVNVPLSSLSSHDRGQGEPIGKLGKTVIYSTDLRQADSEWKMLKGSMRIDYMRRQRITSADKLGPTIYTQVNDHPELFLLLWKEAARRGIYISNDVANEAIRNDVVPAPMGATGAEFLEAARHFLMVQALRDSLLADVKVSAPMWKHHVAETDQQISLDLVEFNAGEFKPKVSPPTTQQVETLFEQYRSVQPAEAGKAPNDPLGFAYEVPNRVKVQYLEMTRSQVLGAARAAGDTFQREKKAAKYYYEHESDFVRAAPATAPSTQSTTGPASTQPSTQAVSSSQPAAPTTAGAATTQPVTSQASAVSQPASATQTAASAPSATQAAAPTTRPFEEVKEEIFTILLEPEADKLQQDISAAIHARLTEDWQAYHRQNPTTAPSTNPTTAVATTGPATTQPVTYNSYEYLEQVARDIQHQYNVLPHVRQIAEWEDAAQLAMEPGIGGSSFDQHAFPQAATQEAAPFITDPKALTASALQLWQPSDVFSNPEKNTYIFRLTDAAAAHPPLLADVRPRVEDDVQTQAAYDKALDAARKFAETARQTGFARSALADFRATSSTGVFRLGSPSVNIPNLKLGETAKIAFLNNAHTLLTDASPANPHPVAVIPMPGEKRVMVAQLADTYTSSFGDLFDFMIKSEGMQQIATQASETLARSYFSYDAVKSRMDYQPADKPKEPVQ